MKAEWILITCLLCFIGTVRPLKAEDEIQAVVPHPAAPDGGPFPTTGDSDTIDKKPASTTNDGDYVIEKKGNTTIKYKKKTTYDFEGASIDGVYNKPSGSYISNIKDVKAKSIIRIRENFDAEVIDSARQIK